MTDAEREAAERELATYRQVMEGRDPMVRRALMAGVSKNRIHTMTGIARSTINRILANPDSEEST